MKHLCFNKWVVFVVYFVFFVTESFAKSNDHDVGFYYEKLPSETFMQHFDWVVVDPDVLHPSIKRPFQKKLFAYVSIGEIEPWRDSNKGYDRQWVLKSNKAWDSLVIDYTNPKYQNFLIKKMKNIQAQGYENFFLDTADAPFGVILPAEEKKYQQGLSALLKMIRTTFPKAKIIANRGFEAKEALCENVNAVAAESLYQGIDSANFNYKEVSASDREWISNQLKYFQECGLEAIVIDYVSPKNKKLQRSTADKIVKDGFTPYITDYKLNTEGVGRHKRLSREVLILYDASELKEHDPIYSAAYLQLSLPLEYLGFIPHLHDISKGLPDLSTQSFAGIIIWEGGHDESALFNWVKEAINQNIKLLFLNSFGFDLTPERLSFLGLASSNTQAQALDPIKIVHSDPMVGFEIQPFLENRDPLLSLQSGKALIEVTNTYGEVFVPAALTPWGGFALDQSFLVYAGDESYWAMDPVKLFAQALQLPSIPVPSATTENGSRLWFTHIDGDGMIERTRFRPDEYAVETLYKDILMRYRVPHSISVIVGEVSKNGVAPEISQRMETAVKKIFSLKHVEPASHSYSHPFKWKKITEAENDPSEYHLKIKGYEFSLDQELQGSLDYINTYLTPSDKNASMLFWTGDCNPPENVLALADETEILTINGGDTTIQKSAPWLSYIAPMSVKKGLYRRINAPMENENVYTGNWISPKWGFRKVIETFELTNSPRRYKPINIYYHFYSASLTPSIEALKSVYDYVLKQKALPLYASEYVYIAKDFYRTSISQVEDGWLIRNRGDLKTVRITKDAGYPDLERSTGIIGFQDDVDGRYIHLDGSGEYQLYLSDVSPKFPFLIESNGRVVKAQKQSVTLKSYVPLRMRWFVPSSCELQASSALVLNKEAKNSTVTYTTTLAAEVTVAYHCH